MKRISATAMAALIASSALVTPAAHAVIPDNRAMVGGIGAWTAANVLKEYIDWHAVAGWGTIGLTNLVITVMRGDSQGAITKAAFTELCGTAAAGTLAHWKPVSGPTFAAHGKAIVKSAGIAAAASSCGWVTQFVFEAVDRNSTAAQKFINGTTPAGRDRIDTDADNWNEHQTNMEKQARDAALNTDKASGFMKQYQKLGCRSAGQSIPCQYNWSQYIQFTKTAQENMVAFNNEGEWLHASLGQLNSDIKS